MSQNYISLSDLALECHVTRPTISNIVSRLGLNDQLIKVGRSYCLPSIYADQVINYRKNGRSRGTITQITDSESIDKTKDTEAISMVISSAELSAIRLLTPTPYRSVSEYIRLLIKKDLSNNKRQYEEIYKLRKKIQDLSEYLDISNKSFQEEIL